MKIIKEIFICTGLAIITLFILISFQYGCKQKPPDRMVLIDQKDLISKKTTVKDSNKSAETTIIDVENVPMITPYIDEDDEEKESPHIYTSKCTLSGSTSNDDSIIKALDKSYADDNDINEHIIADPIEEMPQFPGGDEALNTFLYKEIKYPNVSGCSDVQGTVYATFVVDKSGSVKEVKILRGVGFGYDEEVIRVIKAMPNWKPGKQNGKAVSCQYNIPVKFKIVEEKSK